jgi:hypothetical protein
MRPIQPIRQPVSTRFRELLPCVLLALAGVLCFLCHALLYAKLAAPPPTAPDPSPLPPIPPRHLNGVGRLQPHNGEQ